MSSVPEWEEGIEWEEDMELEEDSEEDRDLEEEPQVEWPVQLKWFDEAYPLFYFAPALGSAQGLVLGLDEVSRKKKASDKFISRKHNNLHRFRYQENM
ncbi:hypothetical protein DUI87_00763 [Hirundo rustica rustica]|uniref:Uncharacterized protein n=1 Tax=Hirundo rustica rustica TaxID=333673 RepID=A0A3M0LAB6_HIRRU|nr:hypothetical protein DUI87_00763 [Hirundo rustica rustica]